MTIPANHPRAESLRIRERIIKGLHEKVVAEAGLIAHGRGEAYDYLLGEKTPNYAQKQQEVAVAMLLTSKKPVISVNGNIAALCPKEIVQLAKNTGASLEINLFYRSKERVKAITSVLEKAGATTILGVDPEYYETIEELSHLRRIVDVRGIYSADIVLVPLEDGDRTMALRRAGKKVITIDLNPLSRTSLWSNVSIVNNVIRAIPEMIEETFKLKKKNSDELENLINDFDNYKSLQESLNFMSSRLRYLAEGKLEDPSKNL